MDIIEQIPNVLYKRQNINLYLEHLKKNKHLIQAFMLFLKVCLKIKLQKIKCKKNILYFYK
ncbi:MAG: hypothetical protein CMF12_09400 [Idiomarina sp.]|nr:hypothetical protein [Idiomarina sp.]